MQQAILLARQYDAVVANPPYMGRKFQNGPLKHFTKSVFDGYEKDIFSCFIVRNGFFAKVDGNLGFMSPFVWMFISTHEQVRLRMITEHSLTSLVQLEYSGFAEATVPVCAFTLTNGHVSDSTASFIRLTSFRGSELQGPKTLEAIKNPDCG
ncbi:MAG: Eco57I restriction-modification methylase domain-containing protein, partial [Planctomycetota bacterium]|nr:Eco57I restriction-modification methylase domain-containing protein [Planctomycetota bacterium]